MTLSSTWLRDCVLGMALIELSVCGVSGWKGDDCLVDSGCLEFDGVAVEAVCGVFSFPFPEAG